MTDPYRTPAEPTDWCVWECGPGWNALELEGVTRTEAEEYAAKHNPTCGAGITLYAQPEDP